MTLTTCFRRRRQSRHAAKSPLRLGLEALEPRNLLDGGLANVLVNDPALDTTPQDLQNQAAIVLGDSNTVIVAYNDSAPFSADNPSTFGYSISNNGGASFTDKGTLPPTPSYYTLGDPFLARSSGTGTVFLSTITATTSPDGVKVLADRINVFRSTDDGATFDGPINATPGFGTNTTGFELGQIAVDNSSQDGSGYGNVYVAWNELRPYSPYWIVRVTRSTDDGLTWGPSGGVIVPAKPGNPLNHGLLTRGSSLTVGPDHAIYVTVVTYNGSFKSQDIVISRSTDEGQTFGNAVVVTHLTSNNVPGGFGMTDSSGQLISAYITPQTAVNPSNGDLYVIYPDKPKNQADKADIFFTQSTDGGKTWSNPLRVNDDATTNDQWEPALAVTPDGSHVAIFWYDRRLDPANNLIDRFGAIGSVSGHTVTFGANFRITDVSFPPALAQDPVFPPDYMGEYDQAVADNDHFYTAWGDNRLGNAFHANQPDVRLAKVPVDWQGTNPGLLVASGVAAPVGSTASADYAALAAAEMYAHRTLPTRVVVGQQAASHDVGVRSAWATIADELQPADGNVPVLRSDEQGLQFRTKDADQLAVDVLFQTFDADLFADEIASALVPLRP